MIDEFCEVIDVMKALRRVSMTNVAYVLFLLVFVALGTFVYALAAESPLAWIIGAILVVLIVGGFVLFLVTNAAKKSNVSDAGDPGSDQNSLGIVGSDDETPLGSTNEHADAEADAARFRREESRPNAAPAIDGGEGEGRRSTR